MSSAARSTATGVGAAVVGGLCSAGQTRANGTLAVELGSGFAAAVVSFGSGLVLIALAVACWPDARAAVGRVGRALRGRRLRWWEVLGGAAGGFYVASQGLTVASLGVAAFMVSVVAGQSVGSLAMDRFGVGPGGVRRVTVGRAVGPLLTVVAVGIAVSGSVGQVGAPVLAVLPLLAGAGQAFQQAVNGRVRGAAGPDPSPATAGPPHDRTPAGGRAAAVAAATFVNFLVGTLVLVVALAVSVLFAGPPTGALPVGLPIDLLLYTGGLLGICFIAIQAAVVARIGVLLLGLGMIAGQVVGALVLDVVVPGAAPPSLATSVGAALTLVAVAVPLVESRLRR